MQPATMADSELSLIRVFMAPLASVMYGKGCVPLIAGKPAPTEVTGFSPVVILWELACRR